MTMTTPIKMTLGDFAFAVSALSKYDGKPWLTQMNPVVDFRTNVMERCTIASQPPIPETGPAKTLGQWNSTLSQENRLAMS